MYVNTFNFDNRHLNDLRLGVATMLAIAVLHHKIEVTRIVSYKYYFQYAYRVVSR